MASLYDIVKPFMIKYNKSTIQDTVNSGKDGRINDEVLEHVLNFMLNVEGWEEITEINFKDDNKEEIDIYPGDRIRYITQSDLLNPNPENMKKRGATYDNVSDKFRIGGWFLKFMPRGCFTKNGDTVTNNVIIYRSHNPSVPPVSVQLEYIDRLFVLRKERNMDNVKNMRCRRLVEYSKPLVETKFPVYLTDRDGDKQVVYYAETESKRKRFMSSKKFERALNVGWCWL